MSDANTGDGVSRVSRQTKSGTQAAPSTAGTSSSAAPGKSSQQLTATPASSSTASAGGAARMIGGALSLSKIARITPKWTNQDMLHRYTINFFHIFPCNGTTLSHKRLTLVEF